MEQVKADLEQSENAAMPNSISMTALPKPFADRLKFVLLPFKVFACAGWIAADAMLPLILFAYAVALAVLVAGAILQRYYRRRDESLVTVAVAIWAGFVLWRLLPRLAQA